MKHMKTCQFIFRCSLAVLSWVALGHSAVYSAPAATPTPAAKPATASAATNDLPRSVFVVPKSQQQGRDPFYPNSVRVYTDSGGIAVKTNSASDSVVLKLNGLSGTAQRRLAIINGNTFEEGEEHDIPTPSGRVHVKCVEIKDKSVIIEIGGQRRELVLPAGN